MNQDKVTELVATNKRLLEQRLISNATFQKNQEVIVDAFMNNRSIPELITSEDSSSTPSKPLEKEHSRPLAGSRSTPDTPEQVQTPPPKRAAEPEKPSLKPEVLEVKKPGSAEGSRPTSSPPSPRPEKPLSSAPAQPTPAQNPPVITTTTAAGDDASDAKIEQLCGECWNNNLNEVMVLLKSITSYDINRLNSRGQSALYCACRQGFTGIVIALLNHEGINIDKQMAAHGGTALHAAGFQQHIDVVALLLAAGANSAIPNSAGLPARAEARGESMEVFAFFETEDELKIKKRYPVVCQLKKFKGQRKRGGTEKVLHDSVTSKPKKKDSETQIQSGNKHMSGYTVARSTPLLKGDLTYKKTSYFCVLGTGVLFYAANESEDIPKGGFSLRQFTVVTGSPDDAFFTISDASGSSHATFHSYSKENSQTWVSALRKAIAREDGSNTQFSYAMDSRVEYNVYVKVWDGRRLKNCKDTFVSIVAGGEEKERTPTQWQSNEPPYNHECNITLESALPELSFTLYDLRKKGNFTVGEVAMPLAWGEAATAQRKAVKKQGGALSEAFAAQAKAANTQASTPGVSDWWDLKAKTTLDVMSKLEICLENLGGGFVNVSIVKASGIGTSKDEKWVVGYNRTKVKGKMEFTPAFKTDFAKDAAWKAVPWKFEIKDEIRFELFENHDGQNDVLGMVTFPPNCWNDIWNGAKERFAWPLQPVEPGSLRLEYWPSKLYILAETKYDELFKLLLEDDFKLVKLLWKVVDPKAVTSLAMALMRACEKKRAAVGLLKALLQEETNHIKTFDTSFRGNTLATKTFEYYMKLTCLTHLHQVLKPTMAKLLEGKKSCELDPVRIEVKGKPADAKTQQSTIKKNTENLIKYCQTLLDSVLNLVEILPMSMRVILTEVKKWFLEKFDNNMNAVYAGLTAFVFLRLIAPAISQPTVFGLTTSHPSKDAARTLMLCAITLQKLSNLKEFGDGKEPHMMVMNEWIKKSIPKMKTFLETLSSMPTKPIDAIPVDHVLIDYGREMAVVADFVKASIDALKGAYPDEPCIGNLLIIQEDLNIAHAALQSAGK